MLFTTISACVGMMLSSVVADSLVSIQSPPPQPSSSSTSQCGAFVSQCYKTCISLPNSQGLQSLAVSHYCTLTNGVYSVQCVCGQQDETAAVLALVNVPTTVISTVQTTSTATTTITTPTTIVITSTDLTTQQTSLCSSTTVVNTIIFSTTLTGQPMIVVTTTTSTATATTTIPVYTSVPAAVISAGAASGNAKRTATNLCSALQMGCSAGCAASLSTPKINYCAGSSPKYSVACICKNSVNVVSQALNLFNLLQNAGGKYSMIGTTSVPATVTSTVVSTSRLLLTQTSTIPTTVISVVTSTSIVTNTYACPTTLLTTSVVATTETPTTTTTATISASTTVVQVANPTVYNLAVYASLGATPGYISGKTLINGGANVTTDITAAQQFVILQVAPTDTYYNLFGVGSGVFQGNSIALDVYYNYNASDDGFIGFFVARAASAQIVPNAEYTNEAAIWEISSSAPLVANAVWTNPSDATTNTTTLQAVNDNADGFEVIGVPNLATFQSNVYAPKAVGVTFALLPAQG